MYPKHKKQEKKKNTSKQMKIELYKTSDKEKILEAAREKHTHYAQMSKDKDDSRFLIRNNVSQEIVEMCLK